MRISASRTLAMVLAGAAIGLAPQAGAQTAADTTSEVLRLERARVGDDTIIAYVRNSGQNYNLSADQIIALKRQGVSEAVINAMLSQPKAGAALAPSPAPASASVNAAAAAPTSADQVPAPTTPAPVVTYVQPPATYYDPYYYYPYGPYYGYGWYPGVALSFGWGWHGGWHNHGGWHGSGGWHSGGGGHR